VYSTTDSILIAYNSFDWSYVERTDTDDDDDTNEDDNNDDDDDDDDDDSSGSYHELATLFGSNWIWKEEQYFGFTGGVDGTFASTGDQSLVAHFVESYKTKEEWAANAECDYSMATGMIASANMEVTLQGQTKWAMTTAWDMQMQPVTPPTAPPSGKAGSNSGKGSDDDTMFEGKGGATAAALVAVACVISVAIAGAVFWYINKGGAAAAGGGSLAGKAEAAPGTPAGTELTQNPAHTVNVSGGSSNI
jgi:hypothetical protein